MTELRNLRIKNKAEVTSLNKKLEADLAEIQRKHDERLAEIVERERLGSEAIAKKYRERFESTFPEEFKKKNTDM